MNIRDMFSVYHILIMFRKEKASERMDEEDARSLNVFPCGVVIILGVVILGLVCYC